MRELKLELLGKNEDIRKLQEELERITLEYNAVKLQQLLIPDMDSIGSPRSLDTSDDKEQVNRRMLSSDDSDMESREYEEKALQEKRMSQNTEEREREYQELLRWKKEIESDKNKEKEKELEKWKGMEAQMERLNQELFCSVAVGIKLNFSMRGHPCNQNIATLYEQCCREKIPRQQWNAWIHEHLEK